MIEVEQRRAEVEHQAFLREKEVTERALKLVESSRSGVQWGSLQLTGLAAGVGILLGVILAK
jgi:ElaB/YqjD/DUF883 family membrane-anchored ribosome-binding protein